MQYSWDVTKIFTISEDPVIDIVAQVHWTKTGIDSVERIGVYHGITEFSKADLGLGFIPFDQLNKQTVFSWVMATLDPAMHQSIDEAIDFDIYQKTYIPKEMRPAWLLEPLEQE